MENYIQDIELINNYINKTLAKTEIQDFESRLETDSGFKTVYDEHLIFLEGLKRQSLKAEIRKAKQSYVKGKWLKFFGLTSGLIIMAAIVLFNVFGLDTSNLKSKLNFESEYMQSFQVAKDSVIEIIGEKGTIIRFNPNHLETKSSKPFIGDSLTVELIELTTKQDLLLVNAQTISNGKRLISGGAFKIDIKANGESLVLKAGKTIDAKFPKTSKVNNMKLFYGERDALNNMNWEPSNIKLVDKKYYAIGLKETSVIDYELSRQFGVDMVRDVYLSDTLGYMSYESIVEKCANIKNIKIDNDTLRIGCIRYCKYKFSQIENLIDDNVGIREHEYVILSKEESAKMLEKSDYIIESDIKIYNIDYPIWEYRAISLSKEDYENLLSIDNQNALEKAKSQGKLHQIRNNFYESITLSKLGWINIDKFAPTEEKVTVNFNFNEKTSYNEVYIIDEKNNTVLNVYQNKIDVPVNRSFYIIAIGVKGDTFYGFKKSFRCNKSKDLKINYKKINENEIKSILTLESSNLKITKDTLKEERFQVKNDTISWCLCSDSKVEIE